MLVLSSGPYQYCIEEKIEPSSDTLAPSTKEKGGRKRETSIERNRATERGSEKTNVEIK